MKKAEYEVPEWCGCGKSAGVPFWGCWTLQDGLATEELCRQKCEYYKVIKEDRV